jgi:DNA uptake protein ComE-like DNA-binding protein
MNQHAYFNYSRKERHGILALVAILLITAVVPRFFQRGAVRTISVADRVSTSATAAIPSSSVKMYVEALPATALGTATEKRITIPAARSTNKIPYRGPSSQKWQQSVIEINKADTSDFISLPFIGSKLAARIVLFRQKLGGFYSRQQIAEVYGIADSVYHIIEKRLSCDPAAVTKVNVNTAGNDLLKQHPYIRWKFADALVAFRGQHGKFNALSELAQIKSIDSASLRKMMPYLSLR